MSFETDYLGSRDGAVVRALASHQCVLGSITGPGPGPGPICGWVCCWFSTLLREVFLWVLWFSLLLKNQQFKIPNRSRYAQTFLNEFLWTPWCSVGKQITLLLFFLLYQWGGVYMTQGRLSPRSEFTPVPSHGSILNFVYMIPPQNVMLARVTPAWVHPGSRTGARISLWYEISQRYHVNAKRPPISVWNRSAGRLERVVHS